MFYFHDCLQNTLKKGFMEFNCRFCCGNRRRITEPLMQVKAPCVFFQENHVRLQELFKGVPSQQISHARKNRPTRSYCISVLDSHLHGASSHNLDIQYHQWVVQYNMVLTRVVTLPINSHHQDIYIYIYLYRIFASPNLFTPSFATKKNWGRWVRFNPQGHFFPILLRPRSSESGLLRDMSKSSFPECCCPIGVEMFF